MIERRNLTAIALLALAALATQLLVWWFKPPRPPNTFVGPPRSSYTLENFTLDSLDTDGQPAFHLAAPRLARRDNDNSLYINAPKFIIIGNDGADWHGTSLYGWVSADGDLLRLIGKVDMLRPATAAASEAEIHTADATVWSKEKRMASAAPSVIQEPGSILRGTGMKADLNTHTLELLADVHATLTPQKKRAH